MILSGNPDKINEELIKSYEILNEYTDISGLIELRELLENLSRDECFKFIVENIQYDLSEKALECKFKHGGFYKQAYKTLGELKFILSISNVSFVSLIGLCSIIAYSCAYNYGRDLSNDEKYEILRSNLHCKISLGLDDFKDIQNYKDVNKDFFKKLSSVKWDKRSKKLHSLLHNLYIHQFGCLYNMDTDTVAQFALCSRYLTCCICLSKDNYTASPEDIVNAWFLTFKLLHTDLRPYIFDIDENEKIF